MNILNFHEFLLEHMEEEVGCLMLSVSVIDWDKATSKVDIRDLHEKGIESYPHVTVLYGFESPDGVVDFVSGLAPIECELDDRLSFFECDNYDAVKVKVVSVHLEKLNAEILSKFSHTEQRHKYNPHVTVAYVRKGLGKKYDGTSIGLKNRKLVLDTAVYSGHGLHSTIKLNGQR